MVGLKMNNETYIIYRLRKRAEIRRQIPGRKSVEEGAPDRIADLLEEAANEIEAMRNGDGKKTNWKIEMNERIARLVEQCYEYNETMQGTWFNKTKFAELIVRECICQCDDENSQKYIMSHFGFTEKDWS